LLLGVWPCPSLAISGVVAAAAAAAAAVLHAILADQYKASWQRAADPQDFVTHPNFYLHAPARTDPLAAPSGCDSIMVLLPVANIQQRGGNDSYDALVTAGRQLVLQTLQSAGTGLRLEDIVHEEVREPAEWRDLYALEHGAAFGLSHGLDQLALFRPPVKEPQLKGLHFVGASTRPGNGVPLVMMGGRITAERILRDAAAAAVAA
jgi:phytoene desaturase (3,4-didehydrolycopene-forming)